MRQLAFLVAAVTVLAATQAAAFNARDASLTGIRLGMSEPELRSALDTQGFAVTRGPAAISAKTRDGQLTISLAGDGHVQMIRYTLSGNNFGARQGIVASLTDQFGPPNRRNPMMWCEAGTDGTCPPDHGTLTFWPDRLILLLQIGVPTVP